MTGGLHRIDSHLILITQMNMPNGQTRAQKDSTLHIALYATEEMWEREMSFLEKGT